MNPTSWIALALFVGLNLAAAASGAAFKPGAWYAALTKPRWTPPNWAFPVVWSVLYVLIATAGWLVWQAEGVSALPALILYVASLALNAGWSFFFFHRRRMDLALIDVVLLWVSIAAAVVAFSTLRPLAAGLLVPYLAWVSVAAFLNLRMIQLNAPAATP